MFNSGVMNDRGTCFKSSSITESCLDENEGIDIDAAYGPCPDVHSSSGEYASRFKGSLGQWVLRRQAESVLQLLREHQVVTVLDIGGGHGQIAPFICEAGYRVTVVGSRQGCAERIAPLIEDGRCVFVVASLTALPFADESFDAVVCLRQLSHIDKPEEMIREWCRVARRIVVADYSSKRSFNSCSSYLFPFKRFVERNTRRFRVFSDRELGAQLQRWGFSVDATIRQFFFPLALYRAVGSMQVAIAVEGLCDRLRLTKLFGSPVIVAAVTTAVTVVESTGV